MLVVEVGRANVPSAWKNISGEVGALEVGKPSQVRSWLKIL